MMRDTFNQYTPGCDYTQLTNENDMAPCEMNDRMPRQYTPINEPIPMQDKMKPAPGCNAFEPYTNLLVKHTTRGCIQEMMGCEALTEFRINTKTPDDKKVKDVMYALEDSACIMRRLCPMLHAWTMNVWTGNNECLAGRVWYHTNGRAVRRWDP